MAEALWQNRRGSEHPQLRFVWLDRERASYQLGQKWCHPMMTSLMLGSIGAVGFHSLVWLQEIHSLWVWTLLAMMIRLACLSFVVWCQAIGPHSYQGTKVCGLVTQRRSNLLTTYRFQNHNWCYLAIVQGLYTIEWPLNLCSEAGESFSSFVLDQNLLVSEYLCCSGVSWLPWCLDAKLFHDVSKQLHWVTTSLGTWCDLLKSWYVCPLVHSDHAPWTQTQCTPHPSGCCFIGW